ncbi:HAD family hydrolase [Magnetovibrio sp. PR-2]|uniref:HAD family hydrolase n=1 Tax=Magnetovibrio sp. PR-2 TaxID=3120356 RepID=UPI002FCE210D
MPPQLVIFDCDGVLVDSEMIASRQLAAYLTELGRDTSAAECRATFTGMSIKSVGEHVRRDWDMTLPEDFVEQLRLRDIDAFTRELLPIAGVRDVIETLKSQQIPICVASSGTPEKIRHSLTITQLLDLFDDKLFSATQVTHGKPAPDLFELAASKMGATPAQSVVIEDAAPGVQGGVAAGMTVLGFTGGSHCTQESREALISAGAEDVFATMNELRTYF